MSFINAQTKVSWQVMCASIYTLTIRNLEQQFITHSSNKRIRDLLRIFLEPFGHVLLWTAVRLFRYQSTDSHLPVELFMLLGVIPWLLTLNTMSECIDIISKNKGLLFFRQIKPLDLVFSLFISELCSLALVFFCGLLLLSLCDVSWHLQEPLRWFIAIGLYLLFLVGLAIFFSCIGFFSRHLVKFFRMILRVMYLFSGIFFNAQMLPADARELLLCNPLFQFIELSRESFSDAGGYTAYGDMYYLFQCALVSVAIGLSCYMLLRKKMMIELMEH